MKNLRVGEVINLYKVTVVVSAVDEKKRRFQMEGYDTWFDMSDDDFSQIKKNLNGV